MHEGRKIYDYCINSLGYGRVFDYAGVPYKPPERQVSHERPNKRHAHDR